MKLILHFFALLIASSLVAQESTKPALLSEFSFSVNYSIPSSSKHPVEARPGFGAAVYLPFRLDKKVNPVIGLEFVQTRFYASTIVDGDELFYTGADFSYNQFRLPFSARFHFGKKTTFFIEPGAFASVVLSDFIEGVTHKSVDGKEVTERVKANLTSSPGIGLSLGFGIQIPLKKGTLLLRLDENAGSGRTYLAQGSSNESTIFYNHYLRFSAIYRLPAKQ
ncbi:MAG: hypothetical protein V4604_10285 [Bacteroidota bacterium]